MLADPKNGFPAKRCQEPFRAVGQTMPTIVIETVPGTVLVRFGEFLYLGARRKLF